VSTSRPSEYDIIADNELDIESRPIPTASTTTESDDFDIGPPTTPSEVVVIAGGGAPNKPWDFKKCGISPKSLAYDNKVGDEEEPPPSK